MVVHQARLDTMSKEEAAQVMQAAQSEVSVFAQPQQLLDVVSELDEVEREQLTEALVEAHVVPEEQRGVLEEAVRPGGYADKLALAVSWLATLRQHIWVVGAIPLVELLLAVLLGSLPCNSPVLSWLRYDAVVALGAAGAIIFAGNTLAPVYAIISQDPVGVVQRWQTSPESSTWKSRLLAAVPGTQFETYRTGAIGVGIAVACVLLGAIGALVALIEWLAALALGCNALTLFVSLLFIVFRCGLVVLMVLLLYNLLDEIAKHRSRAPRLSNTMNPNTEDPYGSYGSEPFLQNNRAGLPKPPPQRQQDFM